MRFPTPLLLCVGCNAISDNPVSDLSCKAAQMISKYFDVVVEEMQKAWDKACGGCVTKLYQGLNDILKVRMSV
jgi:bacterioferritin-associated ferredoxin